MSKLMGREECLHVVDTAIARAVDDARHFRHDTDKETDELCQARATIAALWAERDALREAAVSACQGIATVQQIERGLEFGSMRVLGKAHNGLRIALSKRSL